MTAVRTAEQKAAHAAKEKARRAARKAAEGRPTEIASEVEAAEDFAADALANAVIAGKVTFEDAATALLSGATIEDVVAVVVPEGEVAPSADERSAWQALGVGLPDLSELDQHTLYRNSKAEVAARKLDPTVATPHLDELKARQTTGRKVPGATGTPSAPRTLKAPKRAPRHPLFDQAEAERKRLGNKRGKGSKLDDAEMVVRARQLAAEGLSERQAMEVAYWVDKSSVSRSTWAKAWSIATAATEEGAAI